MLLFEDELADNGTSLLNVRMVSKIISMELSPFYCITCTWSVSPECQNGEINLIYSMEYLPSLLFYYTLPDIRMVRKINLFFTTSWSYLPSTVSYMYCIKYVLISLTLYVYNCVIFLTSPLWLHWIACIRKYYLIISWPFIELWWQYELYWNTVKVVIYAGG